MFVARIYLSLCLLLLAVLLGCNGMRVEPVGHVVPDPDHPGEFLINPDAASLSDGAGGFIDLVGRFLPAPWGTIVSMLGSALVAMPVARRAPNRALKQTVDGIESAKSELPPEVIEKLHTHLSKAQDDATKRTVYDLRP